MIGRSSRSFGEEVGEGDRLLRVHAGGRLVEQQQLRLGRQRTRDLQPALVAVGEVLGELVVDRPRPAVAQQLARLLVGLALLAADRGVPKIEPRIPPFRRECMPTSTFSSAVICGNRRMFWNVRPMPSFVIACGGLPVTSAPSNKSWPDVGL